jgi:GntR family transcriptional regulator/MocR family aminotransferase
MVDAILGIVMIVEHLVMQLARMAGRTDLPMHQRLHETLRCAILEGKLTDGVRLPSTRDLARELAMSRNTVIAAFNQLTVEGYLISQVGKGTFVNALTPKSTTRRPAQQQHQLGRISGRGQALLTHFPASQLEIYPFTPGLVDFSAFPVELWRRLQNKHWRLSYPDMLDYSYSGGYAPLRKAVADYLRVSRDVSVDTDQVVITSGTQQSLELCAQLLTDLRDTVWMEDPAYWGAVKAFMSTGLTIHPVRVDHEGMAPGAGEEKLGPPRLMYVTPSHQYPTGAVMSTARRQEILAFASRHEAWILEDDYDSEFRFSGTPLQSLAGMDREGRVLYLGSFSKVLYPGLKLGYIVVPKSLSSAFKQGHYDLNRPGQIPLQAALAEFIELGYFAKALRNARVGYAARRSSLLGALRPCLSDQVYISGADQGLHLCVNLPSSINDVSVAQRIGQQQLTVRPLSAYCLHRKDAKGLIIGYGYAPLSEIKAHGPALAKAIHSAVTKCN